MNFYRPQKKVLFFLSITCSLFAIARLYYSLTDDIRLANMQHEMSYRAEWEIPSLPPQEHAKIHGILDQPFHYIGKGAQSYAFASDDGKYVLKFFKFKHLRPSWFTELLPSIGWLETYKQTQGARKFRKLEGVFSGYRLAYKAHREESGLLFIHLNPTSYLQQHVFLTDKLGFSRTVDLDQYVFILQQKAQTTRAVLKSLLEKGNIAEAQERTKQIFGLYLSEYGKGLVDHDHGVLHNTGFVKDTPIHLDVGKLKEAPEIKQTGAAQEDLEKIAHKFHQWIHENYPRYAQALDETIESQMEAAFALPWSFAETTNRR